MLWLCRRREGKTVITMIASLESLALARLSCDPCPCGSGIKYKRCCAGLIGGIKLAEARRAFSGVLTAVPSEN
jgi:hypothetical protein